MINIFGLHKCLIQLSLMSCYDDWRAKIIFVMPPENDGKCKQSSGNGTISDDTLHNEMDFEMELCTQQIHSK